MDSTSVSLGIAAGALVAAVVWLVRKFFAASPLANLAGPPSASLLRGRHSFAARDTSPSLIRYRQAISFSSQTGAVQIG